MSILFAGTPENAATTLRELVRAGVAVSVVLTRADAPIGRKRVMTPSPVALEAQSLGIPTIRANQVDSLVLAEISKFHPSFGVVVAFGAILSKEALESLPSGWFNVHYSLLPKWRGAAPVQRAIMAGEKETGISIFKIDAGLDTGDIALQVPTDFQPTENASDALTRLTGLGVSSLLQVIPAISSGLVKLTPQAREGATHAAKLTRTDARVSFLESADKTFHQIRGVNFEPGAWTTFGDTTLKLLAVRLHESSSKNTPGLVRIEAGRVFVYCSTGSIELLLVQPAGRNSMDASDWMNGLKNREVVLGGEA